MTSHREAVAAGHDATLCPLMATYGAPPVRFDMGRGAELWDCNAKRYIDLLSGLAVTSLGHAHPAVTEAVASQAAKLTHVSNLFANEPTAEVADLIDGLVRSKPGGGEPGQLLFQNSGAEANEAAIKLVRKRQGRGRHVIVAAHRSFHGRTMATLAATGQPEKHEPFQPLPEGFRHVAYNDLDAVEAALGPDVGAVLLETVQGEGGVHPADLDYLRAVRSLCDDRGVLLVFDEIQTGLARTGEWFGFHHAAVEADIVTMAKALGNGFPVAAVWAPASIAGAFVPGDHGSTFAGQPLALAAARAVLETMIEIDAPAVVRRLSDRLRDLLSSVSAITEVRGRGLLLALELDPDSLSGRGASDVATACLAGGVVVQAVTPTALRLAPPFVITDEQLVEGVEIIRQALEAN